jgi:hypothetical protein
MKPKDPDRRYIYWLKIQKIFDGFLVSTGGRDFFSFKKTHVLPWVEITTVCKIPTTNTESFTNNHNPMTALYPSTIIFARLNCNWCKAQNPGKMYNRQYAAREYIQNFSPELTFRLP